MQEIETDYKTLSDSLFRISTFNQITQSIPMLLEGRSLVYQIKKSDIQALPAVFYSRNLQYWKSPPVERKKSFLASHRFL